MNELLRLRRRVYEAIALHAAGDRAGWRRECAAIRREFPADEVRVVLAEVRQSHPLAAAAAGSATGVAR